MPPSVAFQGEKGAYSEEAARAHFNGKADARPFRTLRKVFDAVESKAVDYGLVPAENSIEGIVNQTYDLLLESPLKISGEVKIRIEHCLLALPGTEQRNVHVAYSHPQALAQCSRFLESHGIDGAPSYDTAGSAKMIHEKELRGAAAIASKRAAQVHGLTVLQENIGDYPENFTRFFVIGWDEAPPSGHDKTSIVFATPHTPGSLHRALGELAMRQVNLMKIESRPVRTTPWEYHFFVDITGHRLDTSCAEALEALRKSTTFLKILGSYPAAA